MAEGIKKRRWMPVILGLSLAVNLAVVASVSGAMFRHKGGRADGPRVLKGGAIYMQALPHEIRRDLRAELRAGRRGVGSDPAQMVELLRSEPFDATAAAAVFEQEHSASLKRLQTGSQAWLKAVEDMTVQERSAYADQLQDLIERREKHKKKPKS
ncbi:periplasmic heavy metal sensor [Sulfitobacter donghicola]|uniref:Periplasmic heavy metal sensor n=1 Tax=Sulfitobacter donghicola DSW-25 = KCTC 12864 = JCM 14565 TaxID=1300350 RepID=A0A073IW85_9RHOB|nr:periplasmic heavy metal sensor [Sulfitobacter donghicola]KEJ89632.1 hypothetical protein DSW25_09435 [Sulfitobacter donghicola DSW-25 = KCTC 12864 = JCM 14565]KIN69037.1 RNA polymerase sigma-70 factor [Sulfitobacter donghicola DSW-25 = KCTC 12864 = JCM 14565]